MNRKILILGMVVLLMSVGVTSITTRDTSVEDIDFTKVASIDPTMIIEIPECVVPNICIDYPYYDVYSTNGRLVHSICHTAPPGISYGRTAWWQMNWCHQMKGAYINGNS